MLIKNRVFHESNDQKSYFFDRKNKTNVLDIAECAALAMHKAIIGICGLDELETMTLKTGSNFRQSKAVQTYYVIYHLFTCCMLMDEQYRITFQKDWNGNIHYGTSLESLQKTPQNGDEWNNRKFLEEDLATVISHGAIKNYCGKGNRPYWYTLRARGNSGKLPPFLRILYKSFVNERSAIVLYEKTAYIRDRTIYRPSHVASETEKPIQTSLNFREQVDSLPKAKQLYEIAKKIHMAICTQCEKTGKGNLLLGDYMLCFIGSRVDCQPDYAEKLGYSLSGLREIGADENDRSVPTYFAQLIELYSREESMSFYKKYWEGLIADTKRIVYGKGIDFFDEVEE